MDFVSTDSSTRYQTSDQMSFWEFLSGCFGVRLTFKLVESEGSRLPSLMWVGLVQSVEGLNRVKKADSPVSRAEVLLPDCL